MNNRATFEFCDVIGCRKPAAVVQTESHIENEEWLCEACFRNLTLTRPDLAPHYRQIEDDNMDIDRARQSVHG